MNKISKKIVSLVTMAAFAVTLVPAAAFAAPNVNETAAAASSYEVKSDEIKGTADINFKLNSAANTPIEESDKARIFVELTGGDASEATVKVTGLTEYFYDDEPITDVAGLTREKGLELKVADPTIDIDGLAAGTYTMSVAIDVDGLGANTAPVEIATKLLQF